MGLAWSNRAPAHSPSRRPTRPTAGHRGLTDAGTGGIIITGTGTGGVGISDTGGGGIALHESSTAAILIEQTDAANNQGIQITDAGVGGVGISANNGGPVGLYVTGGSGNVSLNAGTAPGGSGNIVLSQQGSGNIQLTTSGTDIRIDADSGAGGNVFIFLPTLDPHEVGALWNNAGDHDHQRRMTPYRNFQGVLNQLAGTYGLGEDTAPTQRGRGTRPPRPPTSPSSER